MFKLGGSTLLFVVLSSILSQFVDSHSSTYSNCHRQTSDLSRIQTFRCPEETLWFGKVRNLDISQERRSYCCGTYGDQYCCAKSEFDQLDFYKQQSDFDEMSSIGGILFTFAFFAIFFCICCKCLQACFGQKQLSTGVVIGTATRNQPSAMINGQNVHVINPPQPAQYPPAQYPPAQYPPAQYPPAQYPPAQYPPAQYTPGQYPPSQYPPAQYQPNNQYSDFNQPPPPYQAQSTHTGPNYGIRTETNQTSNNEKSGHPTPSAPDF